MFTELSFLVLNHFIIISMNTFWYTSFFQEDVSSVNSSKDCLFYFDLSISVSLLRPGPFIKIQLLSLVPHLHPTFHLFTQHTFTFLRLHLQRNKQVFPLFSFTPYSVQVVGLVRSETLLLFFKIRFINKFHVI